MKLPRSFVIASAPLRGDLSPRTKSGVSTSIIMKDLKPMVKKYSKNLRALFVFSFLLILVAGSSSFGYILGQHNQLIPAVLKNTTPTGGANQVDFSLFWNAWNLVDQNFYGDTTKTNKRVDGAISGMVSGLNDPYTLYLPPSEDQLFRTQIQGNFGGIGAELTVKNSLLTVVAALAGTPADKAGLHGQDVIIQIDGKKAADYTFDEAITHIRGEKGSTVVLQIARPGQEKPLTFNIVRDTITVKSVDSSDLGADKQYAYIKVNQFGDDTETAFSDALKAAVANKKKGIIIDLRNNPGGLVKAVTDMIGFVIPAKPIGDPVLQSRVALIERDKKGAEHQEESSTDPIADQTPMVILVNEGSASASEIFAGAMKDYKRAMVVGVKTFGKGSVQNLFGLPNGGSVKITVAKWFTPLGTGIDGTGITPDVVVELPENTSVSTSDPQAAKALELLATH